MKDIYVNSSDLKIVRDLRDHRDFKPAHEYPILEYEKISRYEYGEIKTDNLTIHFIMGNPPKDNCPWCDGENVIQRTTSKCFPFYERFWCECLKCGSRGPILNVSVSISQENMEFYLDFIRQRYKQRISWDHNFKINKGNDELDE